MNFSAFAPSTLPEKIEKQATMFSLFQHFFQFSKTSECKNESELSEKEEIQIKTPTIPKSESIYRISETDKVSVSKRAGGSMIEQVLCVCSGCFEHAFSFSADLRTILRLRLVSKQLAAALGPGTSLFNKMAAEGRISNLDRKDWWEFLVLQQRTTNRRTLRQNWRWRKDFNLLYLKELGETCLGRGTIDQDVNRIFDFASQKVATAPSPSIALQMWRPSTPTPTNQKNLQEKKERVRVMLLALSGALNQWNPWFLDPQAPTRLEYVQSMSYIVYHLMNVLDAVDLLDQPMPPLAPTLAIHYSQLLTFQERSSVLAEASPPRERRNSMKLVFGSGFSEKTWNLNLTDIPHVNGRSSTPARVHRETRLEKCFMILHGLFKTHGLSRLFAPEEYGIRPMIQVVVALSMDYCEDLAWHFASQHCNYEIFCTLWLETAFTGVQSMPSSTVLALWDIWLATRSFQIFVQASVAIIMLSKPHLLGQSLEHNLTHLLRLPDRSVLERETLLPCALSIEIPETYLPLCTLR